MLEPDAARNGSHAANLLGAPGGRRGPQARLQHSGKVSTDLKKIKSKESSKVECLPQMLDRYCRALLVG